MLSKIYSMALQGLDGYLVEVQVDVSNRNAMLGNGWSSRYKCKRGKRKSKNSY